MPFCPICKNNDIIHIRKFNHINLIFANRSLASCGECGMVFASPMPSPGLLSNYNASYFATAHGGQPVDKSSIAFASGIARLRLAFIRSFLNRNQINVDSVFELGPGPGFFARLWLEDAPNAGYFALETDISCHKLLNDLKVDLVDGYSVIPSDLVVLSHVLEHVSDPVAFLKLATRGLRTGGALFIEVPCRDWEHKALDEPHVLFFDKEPMRRLLEGLGFIDIEIGYFGQKISHLRTLQPIRRIILAIRSKLIEHGLIAPFARRQNGMDALSSPLERAILSPYMAHIESSEPAWWLRVVARKGEAL